MIPEESVVQEGKGFLLKYIFEGPSKYWQISGFVAKYIGPNNWTNSQNVAVVRTYVWIRLYFDGISIKNLYVDLG